jgi:hypothetical protein
MKASYTSKTIALVFSAAALLACSANLYATSNAADYTFSTTTTASLTDMSAGTTLLIGPDQDDVATTSLSNIGFDFYFKATRYTNFTVNSNGTLVLGGLAGAGSPYQTLGTAGVSVVTAFASNQRTSTSGKVHYKTIGTAPNRVLVVEWLNMQSRPAAGGTPDLTYQVRLNETTGVIEFVYGSMAVSSGNQIFAQMGFSWSNGSSTIGGITAPQNGTPSYVVGGATNAYQSGTITVLDSSADGSRRNVVLAPPIPSPPTNLTFTSVGSSSMTLNWTPSPSSTVQIHAVYQSTDNLNFSYAGSTGSSATFSRLEPSTTYYWRVFAISEGGLSSALTGSQATVAGTAISSTGTGGTWTTASTWVGGVVPTYGDDVTIVSSASVTGGPAITPLAAHSLTIDGTLQYGSGGNSVEVAHDLMVDASGTISCLTSGSSVLTVHGNIVNSGIFSMTGASTTVTAYGNITNNNSYKAHEIDFVGSGNAAFGGSGATTDVVQIKMNKGTDTTSILELNPANFTVASGNADAFLTLQNGTFKIGGTFMRAGTVFSTLFSNPPVIQATAGFWLNNPNFTINGSSSNITNSGMVRISQGTCFIGPNGSTSNFTMDGTNGSTFLFEGGITYFAHSFSPSGAVNFTITGGLVSFNTSNNTGGYVSLNLNAGCNFTISGGTMAMNFAASGGGMLDYSVNGPAAITGGILNVGFHSGTFHINGPTPALHVIRSVQLVGATDVHGDITIDASQSLDPNGFTLSMYGSNVNNSGAISTTTAGSAFNFVGSAAQNYSGSGTFGTAATPFGGNGVTINNANGVTFNSDVVTSTLTLANGTANMVASNMIISSGGGVTRTNGYIVGNLRRTFAATGSQVFDVGTATGYSPATLNVTSATFPADVTIHASAGPQPNYPGITALERYWTITAPVLTSDLTFQYVAADVRGNESAYVVANYNGAFSAPTSSVNTSTHTGTVLGATPINGDWFLLEADSDFDGIPDAWMIAHFGHPTGQAADNSRAGDDADGDGMTNFQEYLAGTDPQNSASALRITAVSRSGSSIVVSFSAVAGKPYRLEYKNAITDSTWLMVSDLTPNSTGIAQITDSSVTGITRFYLVRLLLP